MSRRKNVSDTESRNEVPTKKSREDTDSNILPFSPSSFLRNISVNDKFVSLVGYVSSVDQVKELQSKDKKKLDLFKFLINNNDGIKVSCFAWNEDAVRFSNEIKIHDILLIQNAMSREKSTFRTEGNLAFEVLLKHHTKVVNLGKFNHIENTKKIEKIQDFEKIPEYTGWIKIQGYLRDEFCVTNRNRGQDYTGSVTDGKFRIEIFISNVTAEIQFEQGQKLQIIGEIQEDEESHKIYVEVYDPEHMKIIDGERMSLSKLLFINEIGPKQSK